MTPSPPPIKALKNISLLLASLRRAAYRDRNEAGVPRFCFLLIPLLGTGHSRLLCRCVNDCFVDMRNSLTFATKMFAEHCKYNQACLIVSRDALFGCGNDLSKVSPDRQCVLCEVSNGFLEISEEGKQSGVSMSTFVKVTLCLERSPPTIVILVRHPVGLLSDICARGNRAGDAAGRQVFSGISRFYSACIPALLHTHIASL
ncbi:hypothetical protein PR048_007856 [Dryococelus australis]|uniref:Uncharacterized protein n=1 Tax=Dryococelus australis TaxID=614101 RepID=A0ABQ9HWA1_9NEOP|nr:hypothetical protein PR048_007856 [Dryococelus australis]